MVISRPYRLGSSSMSLASVTSQGIIYTAVVGSSSKVTEAADAQLTLADIVTRAARSTARLTRTSASSAEPEGLRVHLAREAAELVMQRIELQTSATAQELAVSKGVLNSLLSSMQRVQQEVLVLSGQSLPHLVRRAGGPIHIVATSSKTYCGWPWTVDARCVLASDPCIRAEEYCKKCSLFASRL